MTVRRGRPAPVVRSVRTDIEPKLIAEMTISAVARPTDTPGDPIAGMELSPISRAIFSRPAIRCTHLSNDFHAERAGRSHRQRRIQGSRLRHRGRARNQATAFEPRWEF